MVRQFGILLAGVTKVASSVTSLSGQTNFQKSVDENATVLALYHDLNAILSSAVTGVSNAIQTLEHYSFLWNTDPNTYLHNFLHHTW